MKKFEFFFFSNLITRTVWTIKVEMNIYPSSRGSWCQFCLPLINIHILTFVYFLDISCFTNQQKGHLVILKSFCSIVFDVSVIFHLVSTWTKKLLNEDGWRMKQICDFWINFEHCLDGNQQISSLLFLWPIMSPFRQHSKMEIEAKSRQNSDLSERIREQEKKVEKLISEQQTEVKYYLFFRPQFYMGAIKWSYDKFQFSSGIWGEKKLCVSVGMYKLWCLSEIWIQVTRWISSVKMWACYYFIGSVRSCGGNKVIKSFFMSGLNMPHWCMKTVIGLVNL